MTITALDMNTLLNAQQIYFIFQYRERITAAIRHNDDVMLAAIEAEEAYQKLFGQERLRDVFNRYVDDTAITPYSYEELLVIQHEYRHIPVLRRLIHTALMALGEWYTILFKEGFYLKDGEGRPMRFQTIDEARSVAQTYLSHDLAYNMLYLVHQNKVVEEVTRKQNDE